MLVDRVQSVYARESPRNTLTLSVFPGPAGEFSEGSLCGWPNLLVGLQESTLLSLIKGVTERKLRRSWAEEAPSHQVEALLLPY